MSPHLIGWGSVCVVCGDAPEGRALLRRLGPVARPVHLLMDRAYEGDETRAPALALGYLPAVPPKKSRKSPWSYDEQLYKQRNQVERLFRRIRRFRRVFTRYDKLDVVFLSFVYFASEMLYQLHKSIVRKCIVLSRLCLKNAKTPKQLAFFCHTSLNFLAIRQDACENLPCLAKKFLAVGHIPKIPCPLSSGQLPRGSG